MDRVGSATDVYADGQFIGVLGQMRPIPDWLSRPPRTITVVRLPQAAQGREVEVALRVWESPRAALSSDAGAVQLPRLGTVLAMQTLDSLIYDQFLMANLPVLLLGIVAIVIGLFSLGLFVMRPHAREYAWAGFYLLFSVLFNGEVIFHQIQHTPMLISVYAHQSVKAATTVCWLFFANGDLYVPSQIGCWQWGLCWHASFRYPLSGCRWDLRLSRTRTLYTRCSLWHWGS